MADRVVLPGLGRRANKPEKGDGAGRALPGLLPALRDLQEGNRVTKTFVIFEFRRKKETEACQGESWTLQVILVSVTRYSISKQLPDLKDAEAVQKFFLEEIQLGEELLAQGN
ncbi:hypothetical protein J1605_019097 [Eschrichtius robustus]|uniref:Uncharacterized protein n=1 Tax=Eschrichtius robustus TaxID=9764 RepID=A0AB34HTF2_ESCRO|nr:hypothetical protein J1605_019097 [Eschrichtius robustus]